MRTYVLDWETYYDVKTFTLKKLSTEAYVRDTRFNALCCVVYEPATERAWRVDRDFAAALAPFMDGALVAHHAQFDGLILSHHFGLKPAFWFDTLGMSRYLWGPDYQHSLAALAERLGVGFKTLDYNSFSGYRELDAMPALDRYNLIEGCLQDCKLTAAVFERMAPRIPARELKAMDLNVRMFTEPAIIGDVAAFEAEVASEQARKAALFESLGIDPDKVRSADKFAELLRAEGIEPETKPGKKGPIPAFAKTDAFMEELLAHEDERIRTLAEARLAGKSCLLETRAQRYADQARRGAMPMYLNFAKARTLRYSGGDGGNVQNLPRGSALRRAHLAPEGFDLVVVDAKQFELRVGSALAGQWDFLDTLNEGGDPYCDLASEIYGYTVTPDMEDERGVGKQGQLSCQFGAGWVSVQETARRGTYGPKVQLSRQRAEAIVSAFRTKRDAYPVAWHGGDHHGGCKPAITALLHGGTMALPLHCSPAILVQDQKLILPSGNALNYASLWQDGRGTIGTRRLFKAQPDFLSDKDKLYPAKVFQHCVQAVTRDAFVEGVVRLRAQRLSGQPVKIVMNTHDEIGMLIPKTVSADELVALLDACFKRKYEPLPRMKLNYSYKRDRYYAK